MASGPASDSPEKAPGQAVPPTVGTPVPKTKRKLSSLPIRTRLLIDLLVGVLLVMMLLGPAFMPGSLPMSSGSMQHSNSTASVGSLDAGDVVYLALVKFDDVVTYVQGRSSGLSTYGDFGNVIAFQKPGGGPLILHRAILRVVWDSSGFWRVPELMGLKEGSDWTGTDSDNDPLTFRTGERLSIKSVGPASKDVAIDFSWLHSGTSGIITKGDNAYSNPRIDQSLGTGISDGEPVNSARLVGLVWGELPCMGAFRLQGTPAASRLPSGQTPCAVGSVVVTFFLPLIVHVASIFLKRKKSKGSDVEVPQSQAG